MTDRTQPETLEAAAARDRLDAEDAERRAETQQPRLVLVDTETGETLPDGACPGCEQRDVEIEGLEEAHRSAMAKVRMLRRDKDAEARRDALWPQAVEAFEFYKRETGHARTKWSADRFFLLRPYLMDDGLELVKCAIAGAASDPHRASRPNKNGHVETYDSLETIFKNRASFERHVNRAPRELLRAARKGQDPDPELLRTKAETILVLTPPDGRPIGERVDDAIALAWTELGGRDRDLFYLPEPLRVAGRMRLERGSTGTSG